MELVKIEKQIHVKEYTTTGPVIRLNGEPDYEEEIKVYKQDRVSQLNEAMFEKINSTLKWTRETELMFCDKELIKQLNAQLKKKYVAAFAIIKHDKGKAALLCIDKKGNYEHICLTAQNSEPNGR